MATTTVHCTKDLSGVYQNLDTTKKYLLKFDGKDSVLEEIPDTGVTVFVDGELTDATPAAGDVTVIDSTGITSITPITDGDYTTLGGDVFSIASGMVTAFVAGT